MPVSDISFLIESIEIIDNFLFLLWHLCVESNNNNRKGGITFSNLKGMKVKLSIRRTEIMLLKLYRYCFVSVSL